MQRGCRGGGQLCANVASAAHKSIRLIRKIAKYAGKHSRQWQLHYAVHPAEEEEGGRGGDEETRSSSGCWLVGYVAQSSLTDMVNSAAPKPHTKRRHAKEFATLVWTTGHAHTPNYTLHPVHSATILTPSSSFSF